MRQLLSQFFVSLRSRFVGIFTKLRLLFLPAFWKNVVFTKLRNFFSHVLDIRPRNKDDYYRTRSWMFSRRLVIALVISLGILSIVLLWYSWPSMVKSSGTAAQLRTYRYNALPLKFHEGNVRILAKDNHLAYVGMVAKGEARGQGTLYSADGSTVYEGMFDGSMYNGTGTLYYPSGAICYQGNFINNLYDGTGKTFRENGAPDYEGEFRQGQRSGKGTLFNSGGNPIFSGSFMGDNLLYGEFVGKKTSELANMYTGQYAVYTGSNEYCVSMPEINAVYAIRSGANTIDEDWTVNSICVLGGVFPTADKNLTSLDDLRGYFGAPVYNGNTYLTLDEAVAANLLAAQPENLGKVEIDTTSTFDNSFTVTRYDQNVKVYIYSFAQSGMVYTFYSASASSPFLMYTIELA